MTGRIGKFGMIIAVALLAACSLTPMPPVQLPSRSEITPGETITVYGNENVYGIAKQYNVPMRELIVLNDIHPPFTLRPGQQLTLPADHATPSDVFTPPAYAVSGSAAASGAAPAYPGSSYSSNASEPPAPPAASSPGAVQSAELPPVQPASVSAQPLPPPASGSSPSSAPVSAVNALNAPTPAPKQVATTMENAPPSVETPSTSFTWPVQGPILSSFGPKGQGLSNDGLNIGAPKGSPVVAAGSGIVVYAGNEMKGFGNLVLIRHQGGWVTAYAHLDRVLVNKDAVVAQGDEIGTVGKTGNVSSPQLHFETRYNGKPVDPSGVIKAPSQ